MPARAIENANVPVWFTYFALRLGSVSSNPHNLMLPTSWIICFDSGLKGLKDWFCFSSCWKAGRSEWFSILWINSRTLVLCACFTTECGTEMPVRTVSQRFSHLQRRKLYKDLWGRRTTTADFGSPFWQVPYASNFRLLEDKVQDRGTYLFTISYGGDAMDEGSGVGCFSEWIEIFVIYSWHFNAEFWSIWCEDCFSTE